MNKHGVGYKTILGIFFALMLMFLGYALVSIQSDLNASVIDLFFG